MKNNLHGNQEGLTACSAEVNLASYAQRATLDLVHGRTASLARFFDNRKGTISFVTWRRKVIMHAEEWGGTTGRDIMLGELYGVDPGQSARACKKIYVDLITNQDKRVYSEDRYTDASAAVANMDAGSDVPAVRAGDVTAAGKKRLDDIINKTMTRYFNLLNALTSTEDEDDVTNANDIVMLHEHDNKSIRLKQNRTR